MEIKVEVLTLTKYGDVQGVWRVFLMTILKMSGAA